ncbi:hypothetical protein LMG28727_07556 [Paraburkholderia kirstenboschensis]|nr:hypothetical protein LMG28727_07556 [Paraburkholderia kirstenboschensis]
MPINVANCRSLPTTVPTGNFNGGAFVPLVNGLHRQPLHGGELPG